MLNSTIAIILLVLEHHSFIFYTFCQILVFFTPRLCSTCPHSRFGQFVSAYFCQIFFYHYLSCFIEKLSGCDFNARVFLYTSILGELPNKFSILKFLFFIFAIVYAARQRFGNFHKMHRFQYDF